MAQQEKIKHSREHISVPDRNLEKVAHHQREALREKHEKAEHSPREKLEDVQNDVEKALNRHEKETTTREREAPREKQRDRQGTPEKISKRQKDASFKKTLKAVQSELPVTSRTFSKLIHNKAVEKTSDVVGSTVARPNAILSGSAFAFVFTLVIFLVARHYGYPLSGAETIAGFIIGWATGILFDYLRLMISGKTS